MSRSRSAARFSGSSNHLEHVAVPRAAGVQYRKNLATQLIFLPMLPLVFMPQAVSGTIDVWWLMALGLVAHGIGARIGAREFRQTGRFLAETADLGPQNLILREG